MKLPRNLSGKELSIALCQDWDYSIVHQVGSLYHSRLIFRFYYLSFLFSAAFSDLALCLHSASILGLADNKKSIVKNLKLAREWYTILQTDSPFHQRIPIPAHGFLRIGTLNAILRLIATHKGVQKQEIIDSL